MTYCKWLWRFGFIVQIARGGIFHIRNPKDQTKYYLLFDINIIRADDISSVALLKITIGPISFGAGLNWGKDAEGGG